MVERDLDVVVAGHVCLDIIPGFPNTQPYRPSQVFVPGSLVEVGPAVISTGGPVSNTGISLAKLGNRVAFLAKVGGDQFGRVILDRLGEWADTSGVKISPDEASSYTAVIAPPRIDRIFFHCPGTNHTFSSEDIDYELCARAKLFHLGYPPLMRALYEEGGKELAVVFERVRKVGTPTSLDMALPDPQSEAGRIDWRSVLQRVLPSVDVFHPSAEEGIFMMLPDRWEELHCRSAGGEILDFLDGEDLALLSGLALEWGAGIVTVKSGHRGFYLRTGSRERLESTGLFSAEDLEAWTERELWSPAYRCEQIASATGAGDASVAGFLTAVLRKEPPERCVAAAGSLGYQNLHALDAVSGIRDWEATLNIVEDTSLPRHTLPDWKDWEWKNGVLGFGPNDKRCG